MAPRRRCPVCRSRQWHKEPTSGLIACSEGHILQDYRIETVEATEMGAHAVHKRTLKSGRNRKTDDAGRGRSNPELYHGPRGTFIYFQCLQLVLRKQIAALISLWQLPAEFELVCKDIWTLNLTLLPDDIPPEPYYYVHGEPVVTPAQGAVGEKQTEEDTKTKTNDEEDDPIMAALDEDTSSDEEDTDDDSDFGTSNGPKLDRKKRSPDLNKDRSMASTIAVLALACWMLRIPIMYSDFIRAIEAYELPYLDSTKFIPSSMLVHLTKQTINALSMRRPPRLFVLHALTSRLAKKANVSYGIPTPELNAAPLLWRVTKAFGGTPTLYQMTKQLSKILQLPLAVTYALAPSLERTNERDPERRVYDNIPAELGFVAGTIVVLKMVYGLDGMERVPTDPGDPAVALPKIDEFLAQVALLDEEEENGLEELFNPESHKSAGDFSEDMMDEYLQFCGQALLGGDSSDMDKSVVERFFPRRHVALERKAPGARTRTRLHATQVGEEGSGLRPAEELKIYIAADNGGAIEPELGRLIRRGARMVRAQEEDVFRVMERYERGMLRWWKKNRKKRRRTSSRPRQIADEP